MLVCHFFADYEDNWQNLQIFGRLDGYLADFAGIWQILQKSPKLIGKLRFLFASLAKLLADLDLCLLVCHPFGRLYIYLADSTVFGAYLFGSMDPAEQWRLRPVPEG